MSKKAFCKLLREAIVDEKKASTKDYPKLRSKTALKTQKKVISGIAEDEREHRKRLKKIYGHTCRR